MLRGSAVPQEPMPQIHLPVFQGPLELLLHLIERDDLDITSISLVAVTDQYLGAIRTTAGFHPRALAEFISIGAKLIYLKSRALLPRDPSLAAEVDDDEVGRELIDMLIEYRRYAAVTAILGERQEAGMRFFTRMAAPPPQPEGTGLDGVTADLMRTIMVDVLRRTPEPPRVILPRQRATLAQRLTVLRERLQRAGRFSFREAMRECSTRLEVVLSFLAVLELIKAGECDAVQAENWGDIEVTALALTGAVATA